MDDVSFEKAPIIELVAELRWSPPGTQPLALGQIAVAMSTGADEAFQHFGNKVASQGFTISERTLPSGFPPLWHQIVWRFRKQDDLSTILQVGPGLFSANALQPYRRWKDFRPAVGLGIAALIETRGDAEKAQAFTGVSLRYINAFGVDLLAGEKPEDFIRDTLGFQLVAPAAFQSRVEPNSQISTSANLMFPVAGTSKVMSVSIGAGVLNAESVAMLDMTVAEAHPIPCSLNDAMQSLDSSRDIIHQCFLTLTKNIAQKMAPRSAGNV